MRPQSWVPTTPEDLRQWRVACCRVSQERLASELGITRRSLGAYERGEMRVPPLLPWALAGIFKPLRSKLRLEARRARANAVRRAKRRAERWRKERLRVERLLERQQRRALRSRLQLLGVIVDRDCEATREEAAEFWRLTSILRAGKPS